MILTVTLNAALDATWSVDSLRPRTSHRVDDARERAGGKGINVARVLGGLGHDPVATGLVGGATGRRILDGLHTAGIRSEFVEVSGESRRTLAVVSRDDGDATVFNGRGPSVTAAEWQLFLRRYAALTAAARVVVLSGSTPQGLPADAYAQLVRTAAAAGALTVLDTSGPDLLRALEARPDVVKPNAEEIAAATGQVDPARAAAALRSLGARAVVASAGADGLRAVTPEGTWRATPPNGWPAIRPAPGTPAWPRSPPGWTRARPGRTSSAPRWPCRPPPSPVRSPARSTPPSSGGCSPGSSSRRPRRARESSRTSPICAIVLDSRNLRATLDRKSARGTAC